MTRVSTPFRHDTTPRQPVVQAGSGTRRTALQGASTMRGRHQFETKSGLDGPKQDLLPGLNSSERRESSDRLPKSNAPSTQFSPFG